MKNVLDKIMSNGDSISSIYFLSRFLDYPKPPWIPYSYLHPS